VAKAIHQIPVEHDEHDSDASAKRVVSVSTLGRSVSYEDTNFIEGDSPSLLLVGDDLGRNGNSGYITNDGIGSFTVEISDDSLQYGGVHTIKNGETLILEGMSINKIRITWVSNSSYRILIL